MTYTNRTICWMHTWNETRKNMGLEHLLLKDGAGDSVILTFDDDGRPFRLTCKLTWTPDWQLRRAEITLITVSETRVLGVETNGKGHWRHSGGRTIAALEGCTDIDIWPTPFTNTFPIRRKPLAVGEKREFLVAWVNAPALTIEPQRQAYTRVDERLYLFENLDSSFKAELTVDEHDLVVDYPKLFKRVA